MEKPVLIKDGRRIDGRALDELRPLKITAGVLNKADGSAYIEWGKNRVLAAVFGPKECIPRHSVDPYGTVIKARYRMSPFCSPEEHGRSGPSRRSSELSKVIREVFESVVDMGRYPKTEISLSMEVLQADGGTRTASLTAASVALANAGIPMRDLVAGVAVGKADGQIVVDLAKEEDNFGESDIPLAILPRSREILLFQQDGLLTREEIDRALEMAFEAAEKVHKVQIEALKRAYS